MLLSILLAFMAGFFAGDGAPYYLAGSRGDGVNPSPFPKTPVANVLVGSAAFLLAGLFWYLADVHAHALAGWTAALAGVIVVGLIHARVWRGDPWRRRPKHEAANPDRQ